MIRNRHDVTVVVDRMQHRRCGAIQRPVFEINLCDVGDFRVDRDRPQKITLAIKLDNGAGRAVDDLAGFRYQAHRLVVDLAGPPQCGT